MRIVTLCCTAVLGAAVLLGLVGCATTAKPDPVPRGPILPVDPNSLPPISRAPGPTQNPEQERTGFATPDEELPLETTRDERAQLFAYYRLDDVQMAVLGREAIDRHQLTDEVVQRLRETFSELGMRVQNAAGHELDQVNRESIHRLAAEVDADLVTVVSGAARERSRLGRMLSYEAEVRATVYEAGGDIVVTKEVTKIGTRSRSPEKAAESALLAAANELGPYLAENLVRKVGQNVITRRLSITGLRQYGSVTKIKAYLEQQPGINEVRLILWEEASDTTRFLVYLQPAAKDNLGIYVTSMPGLDVRIRRVDREGMTAAEEED